MKRKRYSKEYKANILSRYATSTEQLKDLLAEEGIPKSTFTQWLREYEGQQSEDKFAFTPMNFKHLIQQNQRLEDIISVLQDSYCSPRAPLREKLGNVSPDKYEKSFIIRNNKQG